MNSFNTVRFLFGSWLLVVGGISAALAQTGAEANERQSRPWMLGVSAQIDDLDTDSLYATFNWGVTEKDLDLLLRRHESLREQLRRAYH